MRERRYKFANVVFSNVYAEEESVFCFLEIGFSF